MIYSITSSVDATMYEQYENRNTGLDEVVQIEKIISESSTVYYFCIPGQKVISFLNIFLHV